jgi:hypothetical protein
MLSAAMAEGLMLSVVITAAATVVVMAEDTVD